MQAVRWYYMILSDRDIKKRIEKGDLVIENLEDPDLQIQPASIDLRLSNEFLVFNKDNDSYINPINKLSIEDYYKSDDGTDSDFSQLKLDPYIGELKGMVGKKMMDVQDLEKIYLCDGEFHVIKPSDFHLGSTIEYIKMPNDLVGRLEGRSSLGRLGIVIHSTAGYIDPGFEGNITLEISNLGTKPVLLAPKMRICQLSLELLSSPAERPYGERRKSKYKFQIGPVGSQLHQDPDLLERSRKEIAPALNMPYKKRRSSEAQLTSLNLDAFEKLLKEKKVRSKENATY